MLNKIRFRNATIALLIVFILALPRWTHHKLNSDRHSLFGLNSAAQILDRSEAICDALTLGSGCLNLTANHIDTYTRAGAPVRTWQVECADSVGRTRMFLQWNARTGLLERESQEDLEVNHSSGSLLQTQAVSMSRSYMATLGTAGLEKWRLAASPELVITHENPEGVWKCEFRSLHANSLIYVSAATGRLINFVLCTVRQNAGGKPWRFLAS